MHRNKCAAQSNKLIYVFALCQCEACSADSLTCFENYIKQTLCSNSSCTKFKTYIENVMSSNVCVCAFMHLNLCTYESTRLNDDFQNEFLSINHKQEGEGGSIVVINRCTITGKKNIWKLSI